MSQSDVLDVCRDFIRLVIPSMTVIRAKDADPSAPRPNIAADVDTYAIIEVDGDSSGWATANEATTDTTAPSDTYAQIRSRTAEGRLAVEFFGPGSIDYARALRMSHDRGDVLSMLMSAGDYAIEQPSDVSSEPVIRSAEREPDGSLTFVVKWAESETYNTEAVEAITATVDVDGEGE